MLRKIQYLFRERNKKKKTLKNLDTMVHFLNMMEYIWFHPKASILFIGKALEAFPLRLGTKHECPLISTTHWHSTWDISQCN